MINIIGHKWIFLTISSILVLASIASIIIFGLRQGIDFTGGTQWQLTFDDPNIDAGSEAARSWSSNVAKLIKETSDLEATVIASDDSLIIRLPEIDEPTHQKLIEAMDKKIGRTREFSYETIGPAIGSELRRKALWAFVGVLLTISLYIALAFRKVSRPVSSWKYGLITLVTLFHDAIIPIGVIAYLGQYGLTELNTNIVVAVLVIMGFSVHDTIVVFDRIRENLRLSQLLKSDFNGLVNKSVNETLVRSVNTSLTLVLVLLALLFWGAPVLTYFVLAILIGIIVGTYSSIFVASPLLTLWMPRGKM